MSIIVRSMRALIFWATALPGAANAQTHGWPIEPSNMDHPLGNTLGEFQALDGPSRVYQHTGIDILATPYPDPLAPWVVVTVGGTITSLVQALDSNYNETEILGEDGITYRYYHLAKDSFFAGYVNAWNSVSKVVVPGTKIARVTPWGCAYDHLHYDLLEGTAKYLNPLADISPNTDAQAPIFGVNGVNFADHDSSRWTKFNPVGGACTVVKGDVDIVTQIRDRDDAGSPLPGATNVGVYNLRWRVCPKSAPGCGNWKDTHIYKDMLAGWEAKNNPDTKAHFSTTWPWISTAYECSAGINETFMVPTAHSPFGWVSTDGQYPDGSYSVSVEASDYAGNVTTQTVHACVQNGTGCTTDLAIRDGIDDAGATPYIGSNFWLSPDITANPGTTDENRNIRAGVANTIEVEVWNTGSCTLPAGTTYNVCLGWNPPSGSVPFPVSASQRVGCQLETVPAGGWAPGTSRATAFTWTPVAGSIPSGHSCLVAWSEMPADPVQTTPSVVFDNNRAQRNIAFVTAADPTESTYGLLWIYPQSDMQQRRIEFTFKSSRSNASYLRSARIHIPAGVTVTELFDAEFVSGYTGRRPSYLCARGDEPGCSVCRYSEEAKRHACTLVYGGIGPNSRVRLEGIHLEKPAQLLLEVTTGDRVPPGEFFDADVVEYGSLGHQPPTAIGGVTLRFEGSVSR